MAVRGHPVVKLGNHSTLIAAPSGRQQPQAARASIPSVQSLCPAPRYLELFARASRPGWTPWGAEAPAESAA